MEVRRLRLGGWRWVLLTAVWACAQPESARTEILVAVDTDLSPGAELTALRIEAESPQGATQTAGGTLESDTPLPQTLGLVHEGGPLGPFHVIVVGLRGEEEVVRREAEVSFVPEKTLVLPLHLVRACVDRDCGERTCSERGCVDVSLDADELVAWSGELPRLTGAPMDGGAERDAGGSRLDAGSEQDAGSTADAANEEAGICVPAQELCNDLDDDCDGVSDNGFDKLGDAQHCGACNNPCKRGELCCSGVCGRACGG